MNAILTFAGIGQGDVTVFLTSIRAAAFPTRIIAWHDRPYTAPAGVNVEWQGHHDTALRIHNARFRYWVDWLMSLAAEGVEWVFLCDGRDVIFQADPWLTLDPERVNVFAEDASQTMGACPYNSKWARELFGEDWLAKVALKPICCCGTVAGRREALIPYLRAIVSIMRDLPQAYCGLDSGVHHRVIWSDPDRFRVWGNEAGPVYTVGYLPHDSLIVTDGLVRNRAGDVPAVVHQWDRHPSAAAMIRARYMRALAA